MLETVSEKGQLDLTARSSQIQNRRLVPYDEVVIDVCASMGLILIIHSISARSHARSKPFPMKKRLLDLTTRSS